MITLTGAEVAAMITAMLIGTAAIITSLAALLNARHGKERISVLEKEITELKKHNLYQDSLLMNRELLIGRLTTENDKQHKEIVELRDKIAKWHEWGSTIGRMMNEMQLTIGFLMQQQQPKPCSTTPLPTTPEPPED